jgi:hypothetical protein
MGSPGERAPVGLSDAEAARRLAEEGANVLPATKGPSHLRAPAAQLTHLFALMLWVAAGLAFVARMPALGSAPGACARQ